MTAMPQMVALFNGVGGGAAALVALAEFHIASGDLATTADRLDRALGPDRLDLVRRLARSRSRSCRSSSAAARSRSPARTSSTPLSSSARSGSGSRSSPGSTTSGCCGCSSRSPLLFGVLFVLPIGGADMPVVISLLNASTGLAASATGFVLSNTVLIVAGMLVGASGTLLTLLMAKAMNRSVTNVLFGAFGQVQAGAGTGMRADDGRTVRATTPEDVAVQLSFARKVVVVPGYGMAVAQAQHDVRAARRAARGEGRRGQVRDPPGRGPHAGAHERAARRGERPLRRAQGDGRDQPRVPADRRRARDRRQRRHEPGRAARHVEPDLRDADPRRRQGARA